MTNIDDDYSLENFLSFNLGLITNTLTKIVGSYCSREFDIGVTEARIITVVGQNGPVSIRDITDITRIDKGWISRSVTSLLKRELVTKQNSKDDARKVELLLTDSGRDTFGKLQKASLARNENIMSVLSPGERVLFMELLAQLQSQADKLLADEFQAAELAKKS